MKAYDEPHDAGNARTIFEYISMMQDPIVREISLHCTGCKNGGDGDFSWPRHLQTPDAADRKEQYGEIGQHIVYGRDSDQNIYTHTSSR